MNLILDKAKRYAAILLLVAPWLLVAGLALQLWLHNSSTSPVSSGGPKLVVGEDALTRRARKQWKEVPGKCEDKAGEFRIVTREVPAKEQDRITERYGWTFASLPTRTYSSDFERDNAHVFARTFGEYNAPRLPYGGTMLAGVKEDGEFAAVFDAAHSPRLYFPMIWGGGGTFDLLNSEPDSFYAFIEPAQTKLFHHRFEGGARKLGELGKWDKYVLYRGEYRSEPAEWAEKLRRRWRGIRAE